jgi:hypothetical protein
MASAEPPLLPGADAGAAYGSTNPLPAPCEHVTGATIGAALAATPSRSRARSAPAVQLMRPS